MIAPFPLPVRVSKQPALRLGVLHSGGTADREKAAPEFDAPAQGEEADRALLAEWLRAVVDSLTEV